MKQLLLLFLFGCLALQLRAQVTNTYTNAATWTVPSGVSSITVRVIGGGAGRGGEDCGAGCGRAAAGPAGYVYVSIPVNPGDVIGIYPGGKGADGESNASGTGGGAGGASTYTSNYNGGNGGNAGPVGSSGGGGGGGAASIVTVNAIVRLVAGGAGGGGGMANTENSGLPGNAGTSPNGTNSFGGNGTNADPFREDGGGGGGGGGGHVGSVGGSVYEINGEAAGNGGFRGSNFANGATQVYFNQQATWNNDGLVEITYGSTAAGGIVTPDQTLCGSVTPTDLYLSEFLGTTLQWQYSDDNIEWISITGATDPVLNSSQIGTITAARYFRVLVNGSIASTTAIIIMAELLASEVPAGSGTSADPYQIATPGNLQWMVENQAEWDKFYLQTAHIDMIATTIPCYNNGSGWISIGDFAVPFTGTYNGQGYRISNLYINPENYTFAGLFGVCQNTLIENLVLDNVQISNGATYTGVLAAIMSNSTIRNVGATGVIQKNIYFSDVRVSGLVYHLEMSTMERCYSSCTLINSIQNGFHVLGGVLGEVYNSTIRDTYFKGSFISTNADVVFAGSFGARAFGNVFENCYTTAQYSIVIPDATHVGAILGTDENMGDNTFTNVLFADHLPDNGFGSAIAANQLRTYPAIANAGYDLQCETVNGTNDVWGMNRSDNNQYPFLAWEAYPAGCVQWNGSNGTAFGNTGNWDGGNVPGADMDIIISPTAVSDLALSNNWSANSITFHDAGRKIQLGNHTLTLATVVAGANANNYIQTNGSGSLRRSLANNEGFIFPVGNSAYNRMTITNRSGSADYFQVKVRDEVLANGTSGSPISGTYVQRTWDINKTNPNGGGGVDFSFYWNSGEPTGPLATPALFHYGTAWERLTGTTGSGVGYLDYQGYTGTFSPFAVLDGSTTLPVTWLNFQAQPQATTVQLNWQTAAEQNSLDFVVQHSTGNNVWTNIGSVAAAGNSTVTSSYRFVHQQPVTGTNWYRLLQRDRDGRETFSKTVSVQFAANRNRMLVYPTPVTNGTVFVKLEKATLITLFSSNGVKILERQLQAGTQTLQLGHLGKGTYYLRSATETAVIVIQ